MALQGKTPYQLCRMILPGYAVNVNGDVYTAHLCTVAWQRLHLGITMALASLL